MPDCSERTLQNKWIRRAYRHILRGLIPINQRIAHHQCSVNEVTRVSKYLKEVSVIHLVEAACFDDRDAVLSFLGQSNCYRYASGA